MNPYFLNITKDEKENILDKHKTLYDGYATKSSTSNEQPLTVQDFANDKDGVQIDSKGNVSKYNNKLYMKESKSICSECGLYEEVCECGMNEMEEGLYDESKPWGKEEQSFDYVEDECKECNEEESEDEMIDFDSELLYNEELSEKAHTQLTESLDMFNRFKKYN